MCHLYKWLQVKAEQVWDPVILVLTQQSNVHPVSPSCLNMSLLTQTVCASQLNIVCLALYPPNDVETPVKHGVLHSWRVSPRGGASSCHWTGSPTAEVCRLQQHVLNHRITDVFVRVRTQYAKRAMITYNLSKTNVIPDSGRLRTWKENS